MKKKSTDDLMRDLACAPSFDAYSRRNTASFSDSRMAELLSTLDSDEELDLIYNQFMERLFADEEMED